jgi:hypothetical protein
VAHLKRPGEEHIYGNPKTFVKQIIVIPCIHSPLQRSGKIKHREDAFPCIKSAESTKMTAERGKGAAAFIIPVTDYKTIFNLFQIIYRKIYYCLHYRWWY